jgi:F0F1-type ATP synthase membrane subunit b/b'
MFSSDASGFAPQPVADSAASAAEPAANETQSAANSQGRSGGFDVQRALDRLEEIVLDSPRIPFGRRTLVDEEVLLDQLDSVRLNLPAAFREAEAIVRQREQILFEAQQQAKDIIEGAKQQAARAISETELVRHAQLEADSIRQQVEEECQAARDRLLNELDQTRQAAAAELEEMRRAAISECEAIQDGADDYADRVLGSIERQLGDMLRVIRNGRQQLQQEADRAMGKLGK